MTLYAATVPFPTLAPVVDGVRERTCASKPSHGVPPHVTLLLPIPGDADAVARAVSDVGQFEVAFRTFGRFPGALWLAPEPVEPFVAMTQRLMAAFPGHLPYDGEFPDIVPHLTVAQADFDDVEADIAPYLPLTARAVSVAIFEQEEPPCWREVASFELEPR